MPQRDLPSAGEPEDAPPALPPSTTGRHEDRNNQPGRLCESSLLV